MPSSLKIKHLGVEARRTRTALATDETMYIVSGKGYIKFEDTNEYFGKKDTIRIEPGKVHSIVATENTILHEVSTPHLDDTIRVKDYYSSKTPSGDR